MELKYEVNACTEVESKLLKSVLKYIRCTYVYVPIKCIMWTNLLKNIDITVLQRTDIVQYWTFETINMMRFYFSMTFLIQKRNYNSVIFV